MIVVRQTLFQKLLPWLGGLLLSLAAAGPVRALPGDLNGDGRIDAADEAWLVPLYGTRAGEPDFEPAGDLNGDGVVDHRDLGLFGDAFGTLDGPADTTPPALFVTLNHIPADQNELLVAPPGGFEITLSFHSAGGSAIDTDSLSVVSDQRMSDLPAGRELAPLFRVSPSGATWRVPVESDLARSAHHLIVRIADAAGNVAYRVYGFAVRGFASSAPLGELQLVFLDFDQDRSLGSEVDFIEDMRLYGLSSGADPALEARMREQLVAGIVGRAHRAYGRRSDGSPGNDPVNVLFTSSRPGGRHSRLCVGGESALGASFLGASTLDVNNARRDEDECGTPGFFGVFPQALDNLWGSDPEFRTSFHPLMPGRGGTPVGEDPRDLRVTDPDFDPGSADVEDLARWSVIRNAMDAFVSVIGTIAAHETGHLLGLTAHGPPPGGLYGGSDFARDHNVTPEGETPAGNYMMNAGGSFRFDAISGRNGFEPPRFRPLSWAYLRDRLVLNDAVADLLPQAVLLAVSPEPVRRDAGENLTLTLHGSGFLAPPRLVELIPRGAAWDEPGSEPIFDPTPKPLRSLRVVDSRTVTGVLRSDAIPPGLYDVRLVTADDQEVTLSDGLEVR